MMFGSVSRISIRQFGTARYTECNHQQACNLVCQLRVNIRLSCTYHLQDAACSCSMYAGEDFDLAFLGGKIIVPVPAIGDGHQRALQNPLR